MSRRLCHVFRVRDPDLYAAEHATVWPEIDELLRSIGFRNYDIYLHGDLAISFMEVEDYEEATARYNASADAVRWEEHWGDQLIIEELEEGTDWPMPLRHVWSLDELREPSA